MEDNKQVWFKWVYLDKVCWKVTQVDGSRGICYWRDIKGSI